MIGAIAGDIIGSVYEQANIKTKDFPLFQKACSFTDDTVMTLALADAFVHDRDIGSNFRRFYSWYPRAGYGNMFKTWASDPSRKAYNSFGNGSAMRVTAVAYAFETLQEVLEKATESAAVTHNHPEGIKGAKAIALATFLSRRGLSKEAVWDAIVDEMGYDLEFLLDEIRDNYFFDSTCQGSVPHALVAFRESTCFEDAIRAAVSIGGDSDTIACMAGSVAGAYYKSVPAKIDQEVRSRLDERLSGVLELFEQKFIR